jgi:hypothetical protein
MRTIEEVARTKTKVRWSIATPEDGHIGEAGADKEKGGWLWWSTAWDAKAKKEVLKEGRASNEDDALVKISQANGIKITLAKESSAKIPKKPAKGQKCPCCGQVKK